MMNRPPPVMKATARRSSLLTRAMREAWAATRSRMLIGAGGNLGLSVGDDGVFLIDDQFVTNAEANLAKIEQLAKGKRFPRLALQMIQVGEESGALDAMLLKTADTFEQETSIALDRMLAALVPAVTLVLATVVGIVILAVLSPIYDLTSVVG